MFHFPWDRSPGDMLPSRNKNSEKKHNGKPKKSKTIITEIFSGGHTVTWILKNSSDFTDVKAQHGV